MYHIQSKYKHEICMSMKYKGNKRGKLSTKLKKNATNVNSVSTF